MTAPFGGRDVAVLEHLTVRTLSLFREFYRKGLFFIACHIHVQQQVVVVHIYGPQEGVDQVYAPGDILDVAVPEGCQEPDHVITGDLRLSDPRLRDACLKVSLPAFELEDVRGDRLRGEALVYEGEIIPERGLDLVQLSCELFGWVRLLLFFLPSHEVVGVCLYELVAVYGLGELLDDEVFYQFAPHSLLAAASAVAPAVAHVIVIHAAELPAGGLACHRLAAVPAEDLACEQISAVGLRGSLIPVMHVQDLLCLPPSLFVDYGRNAVLISHAGVVVHAAVSLILYDAPDRVLIEQASAHGAQAFAVQLRADGHGGLACDVICEDPLHDRRGRGVYLEALVGSGAVPEAGDAAGLQLQRGLSVPALHVLRQVRGVVFGIPFHDGLEDDALRAFRDGLFRVQQADAVFLEPGLIDGRVVPRACEAVALPADHEGKLAALAVSDHPLERGPLVAGAREGPVFIRSYDGDAVPLGVLAAVADLSLDRLFALPGG